MRRRGKDIVKTASVAIVALGVLMLAGCQQRLTMEEAQMRCEKQGGLLVVVYTQKITVSGPGEQVASPGDCVGTDKFGVAPAPPETPPAN